MKSLKSCLLVCLFALAPATARADDGGFWDILWRMDTKFMGYSMDFHLKCVGTDGQTIPQKDCEHLEKRTFEYLFGGRRQFDGPKWETYQEEHNLRVSVYFSYGDSFPDSKGPQLWAFKLMYLYVNHLTPKVSYGVGGGYLPIKGDGWEHRGVFTPASLTFSPKENSSLLLRFDLNVLIGEFSAAKVGANSTFVRGTELNPVFSIGWDFRRVQNGVRRP